MAIIVESRTWRRFQPESGVQNSSFKAVCSPKEAKKTLGHSSKFEPWIFKLLLAFSPCSFSFNSPPAIMAIAGKSTSYLNFPIKLHFDRGILHVFPCFPMFFLWFSCFYHDFSMIFPLFFQGFLQPRLPSARQGTAPGHWRGEARGGATIHVLDLEYDVFNLLVLRWDGWSHTALRGFLRAQLMIKKHLETRGWVAGGCWDSHSYLRIGYLWIIPSFLLIKHQ